MAMFWRIIRRLIFLFVMVFISANTIAYLILNNDFVHDWFRDQANKYLTQYNVELSIGQMSLNFLESQLKISKVSIRNLTEDKNELAKTESLIIGYDAWKLDENWIPSLRFITVEGWKVDAALAKKIDTGKDAGSKPELKISQLLDFAKKFLGRQVEFKNGQLTDERDGRRRMDVIIKSLFVKIGTDESRSGLTVLSDLGQSMFCLSDDEPCSKVVLLTSAELNAEMSVDGTARIERLGFRGGYGDWQTSGQVRFGPNFKVLNYNLKLDGSAEATPWLHLAGMQGQGNFKAGVYLNPSSGKSSEQQVSVDLTPEIHGRVSWSSVNLSGYDLYTGSADIHYGNEKITYKNAQINTPAGAEIDSRGEFSLTGTMPYMNTARIRRFPFTELMGGINVPTDVIQYQMETQELLVNGEIQAGEKKGFTLVIAGQVAVTEMRVPSFEPNQVKLPNCDVKLRIDSDAQHMSFAGSAANCGNGADHSETVINLIRGQIDYTSSKNDFQFFVQNAQATLISYFINEDVEGEVNLRGSIFASAQTPVVFKADAQLNNGSIFGLDVPRVGAQISLDAQGMTVRNAEAWFVSDEQRPSLDLRYLSLGFRSRKIDLDARFDGNLSDALRAFGERGRDLAKSMRGNLNVSQLRIKGNLNDILKSDLDIKLRLRNLADPRISSSDVRATLVCQQGWCSGSRLYLENVSLGDDSLALAGNGRATSGGLALSKAIVEIESVSAKSLSARIDIQSVPMRFRSDGRDVLSGVFDLRGSLQGGLRDWEVSASGRLDQLRVFGNSIGALSVSAASHGGGPLNIILSGLYDQVQSRLIFDHSLEKTTQLFASFRSFEVFKYLPQLNTAGMKFSGEVNSNFSVEGPGLLKVLRSKENPVGLFSGRGQLSKMRIQVGKEGFNLSSPVELKYEKAKLSVAALNLVGSSGRIRTQMDYFPISGFFTGLIDSTLDAGIISQLTDVVSQSSGTIYAKANFDRNEDGTNVSGEARVENVSLSGKYLSPPVTAVNGRLMFQDTRVEIPSLTGSKGNGQIDLVGTIDLLTDVKTDKMTPKLALRANLRSAQFRWPQEFFETVETTIDGQVEIAGQNRPYALNGDARVIKGRAYRDATCQEMIRTGGGGSESSIAKPVLPIFQFGLAIEADNSFTLQSTCIRGRVSTAIRVSGTDVEPILSGQIRLDNGVLNLLKTRFDVTRADAVFDNIIKIEPRIDAQMVAKIEKYSVFVGAEGPLSKPRLNIWSDPSTGPDGNPLSRPALIRMISTGRGPSETTQTAVTQALFNQVVGMFDDPLSQAVSKITRGFVDRFELQPIIDGGQSSFRARASRDLGEKFNLGLDYEPNRQSLTGTIFINESVNVLGGFDRRSSQLGSYSELSGGFRFQFGGK